MPLPTIQPVGMPLANPATPMPPAAPLPGFGMSQEDQQLISQVPAMQSVVGAPTPIGLPSLSSQLYSGQMSALSSMTGGAVSAENDPRTWSPQDAQAQTESALAKIATVNPELAQELAEQHGMQTEGGEGGGFFDTLMGGLGKALEFTHLDDVLEFVSRPAHILPEIIMDWGEESVWNNVADAMSGKSDVSWDDVLVDKLGWDRNFFTAAVGFLGDVALDPLTYLPLGRLMGVSRELSASVGTKAVGMGEVKWAASEGASIIERAAAGDIAGISLTQLERATFVNSAIDTAMAQGAKNLDEAGAAIIAKGDVSAEMLQKAQTGFKERLNRALNGVDPDAVPHGVNFATSSMAERGMQQVQSVMDEASQLAMRGNFAKAKAGLVERLGWSEDYASQQLNTWVKQGTGYLPRASGKGVYMRGKAAATNLGGWRFHLSIPVLGMRIAPHRIIPRVGMLDFGMGRRFFAGIGGSEKLRRMMDKGLAGTTKREWDAFVAGGFKGRTVDGKFVPGLYQTNREAAKHLAGGSGLKGMVGSQYMSASEAVGRFTARFSPGAALYRNGSLGSMRLLQAQRLVPTLDRMFREDIRAVTGTDGTTTLSGQKANEVVGKVLGGADEATMAQWDEHIATWTKLVPAEASGTDVRSILESAPGAELLDEADLQKLREAETFFRGLGDEGFEAAEVYRKQAVAAHIRPQEYGVTADLDTPGYLDKDELNTADAARAASESGQEHLAGAAWEPVDESVDWDHVDTFGPEQTRDVVTSGAMAHGTHFRQAPGTIVDNPENRQALLNRATRAQRNAQDALNELRNPPRSGGVAVVEADIADAISTAEAKLSKANADIAKLQGRSRRFVAYGKKGLQVDLRGRTAAQEGDNATGAAEAVGGEAKAIEAEVRGVAEQIGTAGKALDEAVEGAMVPELKAIARDLQRTGGNIPSAVTRTLQRQGYDHIVITNVDGSRELIVFRGQNSPFARISDGAPSAGRKGGVTVRSATPEAYAAVAGSKMARDLPGGSRAWLDRLLRETSDMTAAEAEELIHGKMRELGVGLATESTVLEKSSIKALDELIGRQVGKMKSKALGQAVRDLDTLGLLPRIANGKLTTLQRYKYRVSNQDELDAIKELTPQVRDAAERMALLQQDAVKDLAAIVQERVDDLEQHYAAYDNIVAGMGADTYNSVAGELDDAATAVLGAKYLAARARGDARDIGNGTWMWVDPDDGRRFYASTARPADEAVEGFNPIGTTKVDDQAYDVYVHFTDEKGLKGILKSGRINQSVGPGADQGTEGVYGVTREEALRILAQGTLPGREIGIEFRVPKGTSVREAANAAHGRGVNLKYIDASDFTGITRQGDETVNGVRVVGTDGKVQAVADSTPGVRGKLLEAHWADDGVFDESKDRVVEVAKAIRRQGIIGTKERRLGGVANAKTGTRTMEATDWESRLQREVADARDWYELQHAEVSEATAEMERLTTRLQTAAAPLHAAIRPADETSLNMAGWERLTHPGFENLAMPAFMAKELEQAIVGHKSIEGLHHEFRRFNAWWKSYATWVNPGFHIRNTYGAFFNNLIGGVGIGDYVMAGRIRKAIREGANGTAGKWANKRLVDEGGADLVAALRREGTFSLYGKQVEELTYGDLGRMTSGVGIGSSNGMTLGVSVIPEEVTGTLAKGPKTVLDRGVAAPVGKFMRGWGTGTENVFRTAAFIRGLHTYGTAAEARLFTMMRHGDYEDLTEFEYGVVRDVLPFYKWMRTNTPFQVHQMLESPGKLLAVQKAQSSVYTAFGKDYDEEKYKMPSWMGDNFTIPYGEVDPETGVGGIIQLDLPMSDLHTSARDFVSQMLPFARPFLERFVLKQDIFTGAPLEGDRVPLAGPMQLPGISNIIETLNIAERGADGRLYANKDNMKLLNIIPTVGRFNNWLTAEPSRVAMRSNQLWSAVLGVRPDESGGERMTQAEMDFYYGTLEPTMAHLRQQGYEMPTVSDLEKTLGTIDQVLLAQGITPESLGSTSTSGLPTL